MKLDKFTTYVGVNECLFDEGDEGDCAYIIETGVIEISILKGDRKMIIATLGTGDLLGEMAIIDQLPRTATALALENTRLIAIPFDYIRQKIAFTDPTARLIIQIIMERYRDIHARLLQVFEDIETPANETYRELYGTSDVMRKMMGQYLDMQDRILSAVNTSRHMEEKSSFDRQAASNTRLSVTVEQELKSASVNEEFCLFFQPIIDLQSNQIAGCEALVRWQHPHRGILCPDEFIPQAEETGLIVELGYWIVEQACRFQYQLEHQFKKTLFVSINLSSKQFEDEQLIQSLAEIMYRTGVDNQQIKYEITESLLMENPELARDSLHRLKETGARLVIDDFGTGYSSFSYLHLFPFDSLKIDREFVSTMIQNRKSYKIVNSLVSLSIDLGMDVVAEGIETNYEAELLLQINADYGQGYYFSRPVPEAEFIKALHSNT